MSILWLLVGRGGSRGVPNKNLRPIGGLSLIGWKARAAKEAMQGRAGRLIVSTDSREIAQEAARHGVEVPFMRPAEYATDTASSASVIRHALQEMAARGQNFSHVMLLEPSAPFATAEHMRKAIAMAELNDADLVVGMKETAPHSTFIAEHRADNSVMPIILQMRRKGFHLRRQDLAPEWTQNGALYYFRTDAFMHENDIYGGQRCYGLMMDRYHSVEIDEAHDLELAEHYFEKGYVKPPA